MKRLKTVLATAVLAVLICLAGCTAIKDEQATPDGPVKVEFVSSNDAYGSVVGYASQTIKPGATSKRVAAYANDYCVFTGWSDGVESVVREGETFTSDCTIVANFEMKRTGLPSIEISMSSGDEVTSKTEYENVTVSTKNAQGETELENVTARLRGRGNATWKLMEKKSYKLKLYEKENILGTGTGEAKEWVLLANHCDQSLIRNQVAFYLARNLDGLEFTVGCQQVEVYINGIYKGVYLLCDQIEVRESRVNIEVDISKADTGYLVELDEYADDDYPEGENVNYVVAGEKMFTIKSDATETQIPKIKEHLQTVHDAIMSGEEHLVRRYVDLDSCIDAYLVEEFTLNIDVGWSSFFFYKKAGDEKLYFGPVWDFDLAMGNDKRLYSGGSKGFYVGNSQSDFKQRSVWFGALMEQDWFKKLVRARWEEKRELFEGAADYAAELALCLETAAQRNFDTWDSLGTRINQEPDHIVAFKSYKQHTDNLVTWLESRYKWLNAYIKMNLPKR